MTPSFSIPARRPDQHGGGLSASGAIITVGGAVVGLALAPWLVRFGESAIAWYHLYWRLVMSL